MARKKTTELKQVHGRREYQTLDQILGETGTSEYGTLNEGEYEDQIDDMNSHDLHEHAVSHGILPVESRERLKKTLLEEFRSHALRYKTPPSRTPKKPMTVSKEVHSILSEGR